MKKNYIIVIIVFFISCQKDSIITLHGLWTMKSGCSYDFKDKLTITDEGISEDYYYYISNDTLYLDYGLPFKIEFITDEDLILSKRSESFYMEYEFKRN